MSMHGLLGVLAQFLPCLMIYFMPEGILGQKQHLFCSALVLRQPGASGPFAITVNASDLRSVKQMNASQARWAS